MLKMCYNALLPMVGKLRPSHPSTQPFISFFTDFIRDSPKDKRSF